MPQFKITAPDGREVTVDGPAAPTQDEASQIFASLPAKGAARPPAALGQSTKQREAAMTRTEDGRRELKNTVERTPVELLADMGMEAGFPAAGQMIGALPVLSVPTGGASVPALGAIGGGIGNTLAQIRRISDNEQEGFKAGQLLASVGAGAIPGGPLGRGFGALAREGARQGATGLAAKTIETVVDEGRLPTATEATVSTVLPAGGGILAQRLGYAQRDLLNATERATLEAGKRAGYVVTPSSVSDSSINRRLESVAGKAALGQEAAERNQAVTTRLAKAALGLPDNAEITMPALRRIRQESAAPYAEIEAISERATTNLANLERTLETQAAGDIRQLEILRSDPQVRAQMQPLLVEAGADVQTLREARNEATRQWQTYRNTGSPEAMDRARAAGELAETLETRIADAAQSSGNEDLATRLRDARQRIARSYDVERALNLGNAEVSAPLVGRAMDKGRPLTGELETIGRMAESFPSVMREGAKIPTPGVSKMEAASAALLATLGAGATQSPYGLAAGVLPLLSGPTRSLVLSRPYQRILTAEPFAIPQAALATRVLSQAASREATRDEK